MLLMSDNNFAGCEVSQEAATLVRQLQSLFQFPLRLDTSSPWTCKTQNDTNTTKKTANNEHSRLCSFPSSSPCCFKAARKCSGSSQTKPSQQKVRVRALCLVPRPSDSPAAAAELAARRWRCSCSWAPGTARHGSARRRSLLVSTQPEN